jgi:uncharacterized protein YggE
MEKTNNLAWIVALAALLVVAFLVYNNVYGASNSNTLRDTITVSGTAQFDVDPDKADLWLSVESKGIDAAAAQSALQLKSNKVIDALKAEGVTDKDIQTQGYNVYPDYTYDPQTGQSTINGYKATLSLLVTTKKLDQAGRLVDVAGGAGGLIQNVQYGLTDEAKATADAQALKLAAANAHKKAEDLTSSVGTRLGKVVSVQENNVNYPSWPPIYYAKGEAAGTTSSTPLPPNSVTVTSTVSVTYALA